MKLRPASILALFCILLCTGCGMMRTGYDFPTSTSAAQKRQAMRVVDATAARLGFTADTQEMMRRRSGGAGSYRRYYKGSVVIHAEITSRETYVVISRAGVMKTPTFRAAEAALTEDLRRASPQVVIVSCYLPSPMM